MLIYRETESYKLSRGRGECGWMASGEIGKPGRLEQWGGKMPENVHHPRFANMGPEDIKHLDYSFAKIDLED
jgi:hypothetical protein